MRDTTTPVEDIPHSERGDNYGEGETQGERNESKMRRYRPGPSEPLRLQRSRSVEPAESRSDEVRRAAEDERAEASVDGAVREPLDEFAAGIEFVRQ